MASLIISSLFMLIFIFFKEEEEEEEEKNRKLQLKNKPNDSNETTIKISACHAEVVWGRGGGEGRMFFNFFGLFLSWVLVRPAQGASLVIIFWPDSRGWQDARETHRERQRGREAERNCSPSQVGTRV